MSTIRWARASHTEEGLVYPLWSRPYHLEMPLLTEDLGSLMQYPHQDELAFGIPIALAGGADNPRDTRFFRFEGYCKAALFLARQMLHFWDVRDTGVPIYIGVSANGLSLFQEYAQHCNFPESHIITLPSYEGRPWPWLIKFDLWDTEVMERFKRRVHFDASLWLNAQSITAPCRLLLEHWHSPEIQGFAISKPEIRVRQSELPFEPPIPNFTDEAFYDQLATIVGTTAEVEHAYWTGETVEYLQGFLFGSTAHYWKNSHRVSLMTSLRDFVYSDEVVLAILARTWPMNENTVVFGLSEIFHELTYMPAFCPDDNFETYETEIMHTWRKTLGYTPDTPTHASAYPSRVPPFK